MLVEVVEHVDPARLPALERVVPRARQPHPDGGVPAWLTAGLRTWWMAVRRARERSGRSAYPRWGWCCSSACRAAASDWLVVDGELLPWSAKALGLIQGQYAAVGAAASRALPAVSQLLEQAAGRGLDVADLRARTSARGERAEAFRAAYVEYCWPTDGLEGLGFAPFQVLAAEGETLALTRPHAWHLDVLGRLTDPFLVPTRYRFVDLSSPRAREEAARWWLDLTAAGGEGMVVKPARVVDPRVQPGLKVRGREYLRIIYGPDYTDSLDRLRGRRLGRKRLLARREHALGVEALDRFVQREPLWRVHQAVFAILALESEPVDPRL